MFRMRTFSGLSQDRVQSLSPTGDKGPRTEVDLNILSSVEEFHEQAVRYSDEFGLKGEIDGPADAFRHAYTASRFTNSLGPQITDAIGIIYEVRGLFPSVTEDGLSYAFSSSSMDIHNNRAGEEVGAYGSSDDDAALHLYLDILAGRLRIIDTIEHENGEREYRLRDTDYRDVDHVILEPELDPIDYDNPDDGFDSDWDPDTAIA